MKDHSDCKRQFVHLSRAWYGKATLQRETVMHDEINIGFYHTEGGTTGEFGIKWIELGNKEVPELRVFDDGWDALWCFSDLLKKMAEIDNENVTPANMCKLLISCGIEDATPTISPYDDLRSGMDKEDLITYNMVEKSRDLKDKMIKQLILDKVKLREEKNE